MTTNWGSWRPLSRAAMVAAGTPAAIDRAIPTKTTSKRPLGVGWKSQAPAPHSRSAAVDPQVPGPGRPRPAPKKVAMVHAQAVLRCCAGGSGTDAGLFVITIHRHDSSSLLIILAPALAADFSKILED